MRGEGCILAAELEVACKPVTRQLLEAGFLVNCTQENVLRFLPPFIIERHDVDELIAALKPILVSLAVSEKKGVTA